MAGKPEPNLDPKQESPLIGWMRGTSTVTGDIIRPEDIWDLDEPLEPSSEKQDPPQLTE